MTNEYFNEANKQPLNSHFTKGVPQTQLQVAFQEHYNLWKKWFPKRRSLRSLEVGCGRGNMSLYLNDDGIVTYLLDNSAVALGAAFENFNLHGKRGHYHKADANSMPFKDGYFDIVFSVGLLEHFVFPAPAIREIWRVCRNGGVIIYYVVPEKWSVQSLFKPINWILAKLFRNTKPLESTMYRGIAPLEYYEHQIIDATGQADIYSCGTFPIPLISHSVNYPFSPMCWPFEWLMAKTMRIYLWFREMYAQRWVCSPRWGQGYLYIQVKK